MSNTVKIRIKSYDDETDVFLFEPFGFEPEDAVADPEYCKGAPDFDEWELPGLLLPALIGQCGEPSELVGKVFEVKLPA